MVEIQDAQVANRGLSDVEQDVLGNPGGGLSNNDMETNLIAAVSSQQQLEPRGIRSGDDGGSDEFGNGK